MHKSLWRRTSRACSVSLPREPCAFDRTASWPKNTKITWTWRLEKTNKLFLTDQAVKIPKCPKLYFPKIKSPQLEWQFYLCLLSQSPGSKCWITNQPKILSKKYYFLIAKFMFQTFLYNGWLQKSSHDRFHALLLRNS